MSAALPARRSLLLAGLALASGAGIVLTTPPPVSAREVLLPWLRPFLRHGGLSGAEEFIDDLLKRYPGFSHACERSLLESIFGMEEAFRVNSLGAVGWEWRDLVARELLLAADIATPEHDPYAPAQYIGLYDPLERTCNIFARFEPGAEREKE